MFAFVTHLRLARKLALLGAVALIVSGVLLTIQIKNALSTLATLDQEIAGLEPSRALLDLVRLTQQHRGLSAAVLGGKSEAEPDRAARQAEVDKAVQRFAGLVEREVDNARVRRDWTAVAEHWQLLGRAVSGRQIPGSESMARHTALIAEQLELHGRVADHAGLTRDSQPETHFLIGASLQQLPLLTELMGQTRARGALLLAKQTASAEDKAALGGLTERVAAQLHDMRVTLEKAFEADPRGNIKAVIGVAMEQAERQAQGALDLARKEILTAPALTFSSTEYFKATTAAIDAVYALTGEAGKVLESELLARKKSEVTMQAALMGGIATLVVLGLLLGVLIARSITVPAEAARRAARRIADGDLGGSVPAGGRDEMGELLAAMSHMQASLVGVVGQVRRNAEGVATASAQIAQGNNDLSSRTEEQASALEETAASMEQLGSTVRQNADNARQANQLALSASTVAIKGGEVVGQVVETMKGINDSSKKIADIISVIDGIAFQTNILALNAAVEAARAGEQGRGFAVVASEVRSLAGRSAEAAKEIKGLITTSVERVEQGTALVDQAGSTMTEVVSSIKRVTDIMGEISAASTEQSAGVAQVGEAVSQMDHATQQNAALVEESAAASESLKGQAQQLVQAVAVFKLADSMQGGPAHAPLPAAAVVAAPNWQGTERRGPERAKNVTRPKFGAKAKQAAKPATAAEAAPAKTGTDDWESF